MRGLRDFKVPDFKFPKLKMKDIPEIDEVKVDYEALQRAQENQKKREAKNYDATSYATIQEVFYKSIKTYGNKDFILEKFDSKGKYVEISYEQFGKDVIGFGTALTRKLSLEDMPRVLIISETTYEWYVSYMTMLCGKGIAIPTDKELPDNELENVVKRSRADVIIYSEKKAEAIKKIMEKIPEVKYFVKMYSDEGINGKNVGMKYLIEEGRALVESGDDFYSKIEIIPDEFKVLLFTSGTTSNAKGVMLSSRNLAENINAVSAYVKLMPTDRFFSVLPLHHTYESSIGFLLPMANGCSIAVCQGLKHIVPNFKETNPTALLAVPLLIENLYRKINANIKKSKKDGLVNSMIHVTNALKVVGVDVKRKVFGEIHENLGGKLRIIVSAAAPIDAKIGKWVEDIGIVFLQGYGLTETAPISALTPEFQPKVGSAGKAIFQAELKIDNPNQNGEGEVLIKTPTLMLGYYEDEEATKEAIEVKEGQRWFHSGDVGYLDQDGFLYITGRSKNVIVTQNGKNIYPEEIELLLGQIAEIKECMVYGKEAPKEEANKELIISVKVIPNLEEIETRYGKDISEEKIKEIIWEKIKAVNKQLTSYKAIKNLEIKHDEFEKTTTMKIKRYAELKKDE
ncbi:MAG: long-chain fatty acid--CoA ligase [Clostridia bacterium]|nr:long-chain fatty acid--CoA ligase [Clostridia bacterium]